MTRKCIGLVGAWLSTLAFALPATLAAQETIASDRPGLGSGSVVLEWGMLQVESGVEYARYDPLDQYSVGQIVLRLGVWDRIEVQGLLNSVVGFRGDGEEEVGLQDQGLGAKLRLTSSGPGGASLSILTTLSVPTGSASFTADEAVPAAVLLADLPLTSNLSLSGNFGFGGWLADADDQVSVILTPSLSLPTQSPLTVFLGYAGFFTEDLDVLDQDATGDSSGDLHIVEGGITWLPSPDTQWDLNGGVDVESGDFFIGVGLARRWSL